MNKPRKQFTKKEIEKRFLNLYPEGCICLEKKGYWYTESVNNRPKTLWCDNLYDVAEKLNLASHEEIYQMKKLNGYTACR